MLAATTCVGLLLWVAGISFVFWACRAPDRWSTSVARTEGSADSNKVDFDTDELSLEIGVSGPIGSAPAPSRYQAMPAWTPQPATEPSSSETDWAAIGTAMAGVITVVLAAIKYIPSRHFEGPWDKPKA